MSPPVASLPTARVDSHRVRVSARDLATVTAYVVAYVILDWVSYVQPVLKLGITPWNPPAGLTLAFLLLRGPRWWPATALAAFLAEVLVRDQPAAVWVLIASSSWIGCGYGVLAAVLRRWGMPRPIDSAGTAARLSIGSLLTTVLVATGYVFLFVSIGALPIDVALTSIARYCVGDMNGILTFTPLVLYADRWRVGWEMLRRHWIGVVGQFAAVVLAMWVIFGLAATDQLRFFYPLFVPVIWITLQWGVPGAVLSTLVIQIGLILATQDQANAPPLVDLQFLLLTLSLTALLLGAVVTERAAALTRVAMREAEQQRAQAQLRERDTALARAMRFAVAGELASALTHELNQPITALVSYLHASEILAAPIASQDERLPGTLSKAAHEAMRASEVLRRLRDFYRGGAIKREPVQVGPLCHSIAASFHERFRAAGVELSLNLPPTLPEVETSATRLEIVLHNLLSNAVDAVSQLPAGQRHVHVSASGSSDEITLRVEDSGMGITREVREKLFEPFVTSKVDGMGLGLAISRSLLRAEGDELSYAPPGHLEGACFVVRLPLHPPPEGEA